MKLREKLPDQTRQITINITENESGDGIEVFVIVGDGSGKEYAVEVVMPWSERRNYSERDLGNYHASMRSHAVMQAVRGFLFS